MRLINQMFQDIIDGETRRCERCWWGTGKLADDNLNKVYCSLLSKESSRNAFCDSFRERFNK